MSASPQTIKDVSTVFEEIPLELYDTVKITDTLQGSIWRASTTKDGSNSVVIKLTNRQKHDTSTAVHNGTVYHHIKENVVLEQSILKYLTQQTDCTPFITKFISFFETDEYFALIQEDGGFSLFDFVQKAHEFIAIGRIEISHWKAVVKVIFKQLMESIEYIQSKNVCHNDISLENVVINDVGIIADEFGNFKFDLDDIQIKLCDFGVAELHTNAECLSSKHCGKQNYKSPEVIQLKRKYNAKMNDVWCSGVCLFMASFCSAPWIAARDTDATFRGIMNGHILAILRHWKLLKYVDRYEIALLEDIFRYEDDRISVRQIVKHPFFNF